MLLNLLDYAAIAVPVGFRSDSLPFGVTLVGPAFSDASLAARGILRSGAYGQHAAENLQGYNQGQGYNQQQPPYKKKRGGFLGNVFESFGGGADD